MSDRDDSASSETEYRPASGSQSRSEPRFTPGTMLADRYRVISLLGSGGMGEVYRADDTKLGQPVALKFLPHSARADAAHIERLHGEVRLGRQVSHPNVCRLYDIGEWQGNHFLAMEYVDGEDLASLLRRIGRLPHDKAVEIAQQVCAGIAAAHGLNIIHRDLKPANIMIDGRGQARITDFGLAVVAEDLAARNEIAGTPAYMAPEQLAGGVVTDRADLYALGLILHEIFTGKKLFEGTTATDVASRRSAVQSLTASTESRGIDPAVQRVIARCLEERPEARPSIHAVIAALPGGDPLQAALDAGETPSPQMIAAAGEVGELPPPVAWSVLALSLLALAGVLALFGRTMLFRLIPLEKPPDALVERARMVIGAAGLGHAVRDSAYSLDTNDDLLAQLSKDPSPGRWANLGRHRPAVFLFHYRQSPVSLLPLNREGRIKADDPALTVPGMANVTLDMEGRLISFTAVPAASKSPGGAAKVDWSPFFEFAGGDLERLKPVPSLWAAPVGTDSVQAWEGVFRDQPEVPVRIEAASHRGKPVWFQVVQASRNPPGAPEDESNARDLIFQLVTGGALVAAAVLARRNLRRGRVDRRTAIRLATLVFMLAAAAHLLRADHVANAYDERFVIDRGVAWALLRAAEVWVLYMALEPFVRRRWPHTLIGWTRLFSGRLRDPMIGRDLAIGTCAGLLLSLVTMAAIHAPVLFGRPSLAPLARWATPLISLRHVFYSWVQLLGDALVIALTILLLLLIAFVVLRNRVAAVAAVWLFVAFASGNDQEGLILGLAIVVIIATIFMFVLLRFGVLALAMTLFVLQVVEAAPFTLDPEAWYFARGIPSLVLILSMMGYGFWASLGDKPALTLPMLDEE